MRPRRALSGHEDLPSAQRIREAVDRVSTHLQQLLADRERLQAATDIEDWARTKLSPSDEEISKLRALIRRIEADLDDLTAEDQEQITKAVAVIRKTRQAVNLGMPAIQPPSDTGAA